MPQTAEIFSSSLDKPVYRSLRINRVKSLSTFNIYPISALDQLIQVIRAKESPIHTIRYLVDRSHNLWFAEEGPASSHIPAHDQLRGEPSGSATCITAGNIVFSDDYLEMRAFNHKSGDFHPSFDSLKWLLAILIANEAQLPIPLALKLTIEQLTSSGGTEQIHELEKDDLTEWVTAHFDLNVLQHQPEAINKVIYEAPAGRQLLATPPRRVRLNFDDEVGDKEVSDKKECSFVRRGTLFSPFSLGHSKAQAEQGEEAPSAIPVTDSPKRDKGVKRKHYALEQGEAHSELFFPSNTEHDDTDNLENNSTSMKPIYTPRT